MVIAKSANVTKFDAGGSGDNYISNGLIKSVEKVWIDTYTYSAAATIGAATNLEIAVIPEGRKITGISVNVLGLDASSTSTLTIGTKIASGATHATLFMAATRFGGTVGNDIVAGLQGVKWLHADSANLPYTLTGGTNRITVSFLASASVTVGTITSIVRYV